MEGELFEGDAPLEDGLETAGPYAPVQEDHDALVQSDIAHQGSKVDPCILGGQRAGEDGDLVKAADDDVLIEAARSWLPPGFGDEREGETET